MTNGISKDLNDLLSFALSMGGYVESASSWKLGRLTTTETNLLRPVPLTLSFRANVRLQNILLPLSFDLPPSPLANHPRVTSDAAWLRREPDWHVYSNGALCWTYPQHYFELIEELSRHLDEAALLETAACWCVSKSAELVERHLIADRSGLKTWPTEWEAWPHGVSEAQAQFEKMKRNGKFHAEVRQLLAARKA